MAITQHAPQSVGEFMKSLREQHKLSQEDLAKKLGGNLTQSHISRYERGAQVPPLKIVPKLAKTLGDSMTEAQQIGRKIRSMSSSYLRKQQEQRVEKLTTRKVERARDPNRLGQNIVTLRAEREYSRAELARLAGLHPNHLAQIEKGTVRHPSTTTVSGLAKALRVTADALLGTLESTPAREPVVRPETASVTAAAAVGWERQPGLYRPADLPALLKATALGKARLAFSFVEEWVGDVALVAVYTKTEET